jgi:hypothetical protein
MDDSSRRCGRLRAALQVGLIVCAGSLVSVQLAGVALVRID